MHPTAQKPTIPRSNRSHRRSIEWPGGLLLSPDRDHDRAPRSRWRHGRPNLDLGTPCQALIRRVLHDALSKKNAMNRCLPHDSPQTVLATASGGSAKSAGHRREIRPPSRARCTDPQSPRLLLRKRVPPCDGRSTARLGRWTAESTAVASPLLPRQPSGHSAQFSSRRDGGCADGERRGSRFIWPLAPKVRAGAGNDRRDQRG